MWSTGDEGRSEWDTEWVTREENKDTRNAWVHHPLPMQAANHTPTKHETRSFLAKPTSLKEKSSAHKYLKPLAVG